MKKLNTKKSAALKSVFASFGLTFLKLVVGILTGSMAIISEAAHSGLDFLAAVMTLAAVNMGDKPADRDHPYGHGKYESISALLETCLLVLTSGFIIYEATSRLIHGNSAVRVTWYSFAIVIISIIVDIVRARALSKVAKETKSQALEADALHFSSDILSSVVVLIGLVFVYFGHSVADSIAAIAVSLVVLYAAFNLGRRTVDVLTDAAPAGISDQIRSVVANIKGIVDIENLRARVVGPVTMIDLTVFLPRKDSLIQTSEKCKIIEDKIKAIFPDSDLSIHAKPLLLNDETVTERVQIIANKLGLFAHNILFHQDKDKNSLNFDIEIDEILTLLEAHAIAEKIEKEMQLEFGDIEVNIHIEPMRTNTIIEKSLSKSKEKEISDLIYSIAAKTNLINDVHDISMKRSEDGILVVLHCLCDKQLSLTEVHNATSLLEHQIRDGQNEIHKVVIHAEPA